MFYSSYPRKENPEETILVIYIDDILLDVVGEILKLKVNLSSYNCKLEFKCYASDLFEQFNTFQT